MIEVPVGGTPIEPLSALEGPPCFAHDGRYLGRGPLSMERDLRIGWRRKTEDVRYFEVMHVGSTEADYVEIGACDAIGRPGARHGDPAYAWQAVNERSTLHFELELVGWRIAKLEKFGPNCEPEYRQWTAEMKQLEAHEKLLRKQLAPEPKKKR